MAWEVKDILVTLDQAMQLEKDGRQFYLTAAERTRDGAGKKMFLSLADDELQHLEKLKREYDELSTAGKWLQSVDVLVRQPGRWRAPVEIFSTEREGVEEVLRPDAADVDALEFAIGAEKQSYDLYAASRDKAADPDAKALFSFLAREEKAHYELLETALAYLNNTATFFLVEEGALNEG